LADDFEDQIEMFYSLPKIKYPRKEIKFSPSQLGLCGRELFYLNSGAEADPHEPIVGWKARIPRNGEGVHEVRQKDLLTMPKQLNDNGLLCRFQMRETEKVLRRSFDVDGTIVTFSGRVDGILLDVETGQLVIWEFKTKDKASGLSKVKDPSPYIMQCIAYAAVLEIYDVILHVESLQKPQWSRDDAKDTKYFHVQVSKEQCDELLQRLAGIVRAIETGIPPAREFEKCRFCSYKNACREDG
jgi:CRISPR/Cas system-associated exonuclease Cas4 (RecB family)